MSEQLSREELEEACKHVKVELPADTKHHAKVLLRKKLLEKMEKDGLVKLIDKFADNTDLIVAMSDTVGLEEEDADKINGKSKAKEISKEIVNVGLEAVLSRFDVPFLKDICDDLKVSASTVNKSKIIKAIITGKSVKASSSKDNTVKKARDEALKAAEKAASMKNKPDIKKGVTYQELFQQYLRSELFEYCKENDLKVSGSKPELIKRILAFLAGDLENTKAVPKKKAEGKKEAPKSPKKAATKKKDDKKKDDKKKEEKEKEKEESKEETKEKEKEKDTKKKDKKWTADY